MLNPGEPLSMCGAKKEVPHPCGWGTPCSSCEENSESVLQGAGRGELRDAAGRNGHGLAGGGVAPLALGALRGGSGEYTGKLDLLVSDERLGDNGTAASACALVSPALAAMAWISSRLVIVSP